MINAPNRLKHTAISTETSEKIRQKLKDRNCTNNDWLNSVLCSLYASINQTPDTGKVAL
jgi:hypothetical protein